MLTKEEYIKKHGVSEKEFLYYCINCLNNEFMRDADDNVNDLKGFLYDLVLDYFKLKEKYSKILDDVHDYRYETHCMKMTIRNLCEHFEVESEKELQNIYLNKPYKFEELHEGMWVWDDEYKQCIKIKLVFMPCKEYQKGSLKIYHNLNEDNDLDFVEFEENRFFPVNVGSEK